MGTVCSCILFIQEFVVQFSVQSFIMGVHFQLEVVVYNTQDGVPAARPQGGAFKVFVVQLFV
jgi:hypothetical protein